MTRLATPIFDHNHSKYFCSTFNFWESVSTWKTSACSICSFFKYSQFYSPVTRPATLFCYHTHPKNFQLSFNFSEFVLAFAPACKKIGNSNCSFLRYIVNLEFRDQIDHTHILTMPNQKLFRQLAIFVNLHQHAKNEAVSSICSGEIVDLKILQSDWLRAFWPISHEQDFSQI